MLSCAELLGWSERVLIIRSPRASPAFKCECETSSPISSYIFFSPRRIKGGVNWYRINCALFNWLRYASIIEHESLKAEIILCPTGASFQIWAMNITKSKVNVCSEKVGIFFLQHQNAGDFWLLSKKWTFKSGNKCMSVKFQVLLWDMRSSA